MRRWLSFFWDYSRLVFAILAKRSPLADRILQKRGHQAVPGAPRRQGTGREGLLGSTGEVRSGFLSAVGEERSEKESFRGKVRIRGETWFAESAVPLARGDEVRILEIEGLTLHVEPVKE